MNVSTNSQAFDLFNELLRTSDALEVLTNTIPIDLHLKMRQAQEVVQISAKHEEDPLKKAW